MRRIFLGLLCFSAMAMGAGPHTVPLRSNGTVVAWLVALPLPNDQINTPGKGCSGFYIDWLTAMGGEAAVKPQEGERLSYAPDKSIAWQPVYTDSSGIINFLNLTGGTIDGPAVAYAFCIIHSPSARKVTLQAGSDDAIRLWLNQELVLDHHIHRRLTPGEEQITVSLLKGENRLLAKIDQAGGNWGFHFALTPSESPSYASTITLQNPPKTKIFSARLQTTALRVQTAAGERQKGRLEIITSGLANGVCKISQPDWATPVSVKLGPLPAGKCFREVLLPISPSAKPLQAVITSGTEHYTLPAVPASAMKPWTVYLVQHVHTDIGYTRPQTEILPEHLRYIDYALDFCDLTDSYPEDSKFRWTCETSWAVREYLACRPQKQIDRLKQRIAEGRIEVTGMFLNMSDIADEATLAASLQPLEECRRVLQAPIVTAMQNDVNGLAWCLADYFHEAGIRYVSMGINKTRSLLPFDRPTAFWWESPCGKRVLAWRPDHYHTGNNFEIHQGRIDLFEPLLLEYLQSLEESGYPFDRIAVQYSGYRTDNSPPAMIECDLVKAWNEKYISPKLRIATAREFLDYVAAHHSDQLPVHRQAWPDWWTDGFGSAARETAAARQMQIAMQVNQGLLTMARLQDLALPAGIDDHIRLAMDALLFYDEHTFGAAESISDPLAENTMIQWGEKSSYAWEGVKRTTMLREECMGLLQNLIPRSQAPTIAVFNTLNWPRSGLIETFIDNEMLQADKSFRIIDAETGESVAAQKLASRQEGAYWALWAKEVPALGFKCYRILSLDDKVQAGMPEAKNEPVMENAYYRLQVDPHTGAIRSLLDKETGAELVDGNSPWQLGQFIYEKLNGDRNTFRGEFLRSSLQEVNIEPQENGPVWKSLLIKGEAEGLQPGSGLQCEVRLYETEKRIELIYRGRKLPISAPEAVYIAFPFALRNRRTLYECQGGMVTPGSGQIPRSASDWQAMQKYALLQGEEGQIVWGSRDIPLVQLGEINLGKWMETTEIKTAHLYSWVMNNYWFTNFLAKQEGELAWRYYLTSHSTHDPAAAARFGWGSAVPLAVRVLAPGAVGKQKPVFTGLASWPDHVLLVSSRPARYGNGVVLQLRETGGREASIRLDELLQGKILKNKTHVNVLEEPLNGLDQQLVLQPFEAKMIKLEW